MSSPPAELQSPPIENFLATVLAHLSKCWRSRLPEKVWEPLA